MKTLRVYVDTSVIGGCFDPEFAEWSNALVERFRQGKVIPILSDVIGKEIEQAPSVVRRVYSGLVESGADVIAVSDEALELLDAYAARGVLGARFRTDMLHIALATVADVDVLVSWNFRHIVRLDKIRLFNAVNLEQGYKPLLIYSPREVVSDDKND